MLSQTAADLPLRDIHLPDAIHWWPLALGWWILFFLLLVAVVLGCVVIRKLLKPNLRKEALKALNEIETCFEQTQDASKCIGDISSFLRRVTVSQSTSPHLAGITGKVWLEYLDKGLDQPEFSNGIGQVLLTGPYCQNPDAETISKLILLCRKWVKTL
ncbi:MAG: DUF4381 domain-containing protein [Parachlamydiaceae bacterium]|nr:DUF4381 domain-containing protein [Parachlamydiaceae bacterium]